MKRREVEGGRNIMMNPKTLLMCEEDSQTVMSKPLLSSIFCVSEN